MMSHFNLKTLTFYAVAITSVVVLFKGVTAYGNEHLKAPPAVGGVYRINAQSLPGCLQSDTLVLTIKQSGIYLFGFLRPGEAPPQMTTIAAEKPSLSGQFNHQQLRLNGAIPWITRCRHGQAQQINIQGIVQGETLKGQITLNSTPTAEFTAQRETSME